MNKKIILSKSNNNILEAAALLSGLIKEFSKYTKSNYQDRQDYFEKIKITLQGIIFSPNLSTLEKCFELNRFKSELELAKVNALEYQVKQINQVISEIVLPAENNLLQRLQIEKKYGVIEKKLSEEKSTPKEMNSNSEDVIRIHPKTQPEQEKKSENENESNNSESELVGMKKDKFEFSSDESLPDSSPKIPMNISKEEVHSFFERLCICKNELNNKPYLSYQDLDQFLSQYFIGYSEKPVPHKLLELNLFKKQYGIIYSFVYQFYQKNVKRYDGGKNNYALLLKENFICFREMDDDTLYSSIRNHSRFMGMELFDFKK